jgi:hypothetical protein
MGLFHSVLVVYYLTDLIFLITSALASSNEEIQLSNKKQENNYVTLQIIFMLERY